MTGTQIRLATAVALVAMALATPHAQTATQTKEAAGAATVTSRQITGEVLEVFGQHPRR